MKTKTLLSLPALVLTLQANAECSAPRPVSATAGDATAAEAMLATQASVGSSIQAYLECRQREHLAGRLATAPSAAEKAASGTLEWQRNHLPGDAFAGR